MALASPEVRTILAANGSHARDDRDPEAALSILLNSAEKRRNDNAENNDDHGREAILAMMLSSASTLVQVVYQRQGGGSHNLLSIIAFVVSLFGYLGYKYFSRARISAARTCSSVRISAARICSSVALFSASLALASLLAMPLHGIKLKCIPYAICFFPLLSLLSSFYSCLKGSHDNPPTSAKAADSPSSSLPSPTASSGRREVAAVTPTTTAEAADVMPQFQPIVKVLSISRSEDSQKRIVLFFQASLPAQKAPLSEEGISPYICRKPDSGHNPR